MRLPDISKRLISIGKTESPSLEAVWFSDPPALRPHFDFRDGQLFEHGEFLVSQTRGPDALQVFLRGYHGLEDSVDARTSEECVRFGLNVELVLQSLPSGGDWIDCGSMGHDAHRVVSLNRSINPTLCSYEGCLVGLGDHGLRYLTSPDQAQRWLHVQQVDFEHSPLPSGSESMDLLTCFETLEHFKFGPQLFMLEVNRVLKPGAKLIASVPNSTSAAALSRLLQGDHPAMASQYHRDMTYGRIHPSEYSPVQLRDLVTSYGFRVDAFTTFQCLGYAGHEVDAIEFCHSGGFRNAAERDDMLGAHLLVVATKLESVVEPCFVPSLWA